MVRGHGEARLEFLKRLSVNCIDELRGFVLFNSVASNGVVAQRIVGDSVLLQILSSLLLATG